MVFGLVALIAPVVIVPIYTFWMRFVAAPLGWLNTRLFLGLTFYLMFTPVALFLWLRRKLEPKSDTQIGRAHV